MGIEREITQIFADVDSAKFAADEMVYKAVIDAERRVVELLRAHGIDVSEERLAKAFLSIRVSSVTGRCGPELRIIAGTDVTS
jgi:hypothetical protein